MMRSRYRWLPAALLALACAYPSPPPPAAPPADQAAPSARLAALANEYWELRLRRSPFFATSLGDRRYDAEVPDESPEGLAEDVRLLRDLQARVREVSASALAGEDLVTRSMLLQQLEDGL